MAGAQLNSVFPFSPSQAVSESRIFEQEYHILRYCLCLRAKEQQINIWIAQCTVIPLQEQPLTQIADSKEGKLQDQSPIDTLDSSKEDEEYKPYRALGATYQSKGHIGSEGGSSLDKLLDKLRKAKW